MMSRWGIGIKMTIISLMYLTVASYLTYLYPDFFLIKNVPYPFFVVIGIILLIVGIPMLIISARAFTVGFNKGGLVTTGIFSVVRNPIYAAWILFILPGIMIFFQSWLMLATSLVTYIIFKAFIKGEEQYLEKTFGQAYLDYKSKVNELFPFPKFHRHS